MPTNLGAHTHVGTNPAYISVNRTDSGEIEISVRNEVHAKCNCPGVVSSIKLTQEQYQVFLADLVKGEMGLSKEIY